jgi:hypothetical protein
MRKILILLLLCPFAYSQSINAILGDRSWTEHFGECNLAEATEKERISTHLNYVLQLLMADEATKSNGPKRERMLKLLQRYIDSAVFPQTFSYAFAERRPCFIDDEGRLCAVGYLIAETAGRTEAVRINAQFRFHYLLDMQDEKLLSWQKESGLSLKELAMIQPTYRIPAQRISRASQVFYDSERQLFGLKDMRNGEILLKADYQQLLMAKDINFVMGRKNENWHLLNLKGEKQSRRNFTQIVFLEDSLLKLAIASTKKGDLYLFSDSMGLLAKHKNSTFDTTFLDLLILKSGDSLSAWKNGKKRLDYPAFSAVSLIYRLANCAPVLRLQKHNLYGLYSLEGKLISPLKWQEISMQQGLFVGHTATGKVLIGPDGKEWPYPENADFLKSHNDRCLILETEAGLGLFDSEKMQWLIKPQFKKITFLPQYELYEVSTENHRGYYNFKGQELIPPIYDYSRLYADCIIVKRAGKMGLIDQKNRVIIPLNFDTLAFGIWPADSDDYGKLLYKTKKNGRLQLWTSDGKEVPLPEASEELYSLGSHICLLKTKEGMRVVVSKNQALVNHSELLVDSAYSFGFKGLIYLKNKKWGFYRIPSGASMGAPEIGPAVYDTIIYSSSSDRDRYIVQQNGLWGMYSYAKNELIESAKHEAFYPLDLSNRMERVFFYANKKWHQNHLGQSIPSLEEPYNSKLSHKFNIQREQLKAYWISEIQMH